MQTKLYPVIDLKVGPLLTELENFFRMQGHQVQVLQIGNGHILQALKETTLSAITGQSSALTVKIAPEPNGTLVELGSSKWIDKAAMGVIGYVIMPVLAIIPLIGAYNQFKLGEDVWRIVNAFMARNQPQGWGAQPPPYPGAWPVCKKCGASNQGGARFCSSCGERFAE
jgi:hypothetical protein